MKKSVIRPLQAFTVVAALLLGSAHAQSAEAGKTGDQPAKTKAGKKAVKTQAPGQGGKVKFMPGSGETASQRVARLKRECKGAVNAGVCEGYTR